MKRVKIKGVDRHVHNKKGDREGEPNFYTMPPVRAGLLPPGIAVGATQGGVAAVTIVAATPHAAVMPSTASPAVTQPATAQASPATMPFGYSMQPGFGFPMHAPPGPFTMAQMQPASAADTAASRQGNPQQQQSQQPVMYPYPFYGFPPPWMAQQQQQQPPPMGSLPSSPAQASAPPTPATNGQEEETPIKTESE